MTIFFFWSAVSLGILSGCLPLLWRETLALSVEQSSMAVVALAVGGLGGLPLAWAVVRTQAKAWLIAAGLLQLAGTLLLTIPSPVLALELRLAGGFLAGLGADMIVLAAGRGVGVSETTRAVVALTLWP